MSPRRCSDLSREAGEPLVATATTATRWLLVEVPGTWPRDVSAEDALPGTARWAVDDWLARTPASKLLLVRRPGGARNRTLVFSVQAEEHVAETHRLELSGPEKLASVDLDRDGDRVDGSLVLVCGHGTRDACCALRGTAVYGVLAATLPDETLWISSHHGGHRFAPNVLVLPAGLQFGRVDPDAAAAVVASALAGTIELDRYRGRTCYEPAIQAAEHAVRTAAGLEEIDDLRFLDADGPVVRFRAADGTAYAAIVETHEGPVVPASCGADAEAQRVLSARIG